MSNNIIVTSLLLTFNFSGCSFRYDACTIMKQAYLTPLSLRTFLIPRYPIFKKVVVKFVAGITSLV
eukprot:461211-Ditylum_brightwellii.AAC.1